MKRILTSLVLVASVYSFAQVSVSGENNHTPKATLDVEAIDNKTTPDGILIPRVTTKMAQDMPQPETSTLVYIKEENIKTGGGTRTVDVDVAGFYYFNGTKWVKLGGGESSSNKTIRKVKAITVSEWNDGQFALIQTTDADIELPPANDANKNRIIAINLIANSPANYVSPAPVSNSAIMPGKGQLLMCDGKRWYVIGGL